MSARYRNMTSGYSMFEAGQKLRTFFAELTVQALQSAGIRPNGGTLDKPRFDRKLVDQLATIRRSQGKQS